MHGEHLIMVHNGATRKYGQERMVSQQNETKLRTEISSSSRIFILTGALALGVIGAGVIGAIAYSNYEAARLATIQKMSKEFFSELSEIQAYCKINGRSWNLTCQYACELVFAPLAIINDCRCKK